MIEISRDDVIQCILNKLRDIHSQTGKKYGCVRRLSEIANVRETIISDVLGSHKEVPPKLCEAVGVQKLYIVGGRRGGKRGKYYLMEKECQPVTLKASKQLQTGSEKSSQHAQSI